VQKAGERLCNAFREDIVVEGRPFKIRISIGVAVYPENGGDYDLLLKKADEALFAVKREGKNSIRFAS
jgi:diguanylate cyclase (GGDEF)-like protein